jgi:drug/metabolite transporter (DMT)-like permease
MRDISYALFSVAAWSTNYLVGRSLVAGGVDPVAMSILRFAVATPLLFLMARFPPYRGAARRLALLGLLGVAGFNLLLYSSLAYVTAAVASLFVVLASPATQLLEAALARRRPGGVALLGSLAAVAGAYLTLEPYLAVRSYLGPLLAALATLSWAVYTVLVRDVYRLYSHVEAVAWISLFGLAAMSPTVAFSKPESLADPLVLALVVYVAAVPGALAYAAWNVAVQKAGSRRSAAVLPLMPVLTTLLSYLLLGEALTATQLIGMAVAVAGVYISVRG